MNDTPELVHHCLKVFNRHDIGGVAEIFADDLVNHCAIPTAQGRTGIVAIWQKLWEAFPDLSWTCEDVVAAGDRIVLRLRMRGTNLGALRFARMPLGPTGKTVDAEAIYILRIAGGKVAELWAQRDEVGMLRQLGHFMSAGGPS